MKLSSVQIFALFRRKKKNKNQPECKFSCTYDLQTKDYRLIRMHKCPANGNTQLKSVFYERLKELLKMGFGRPHKCHKKAKEE